MSTEVAYNIYVQKLTPRTVIKGRNAQPQMCCTAEWMTRDPPPPLFQRFWGILTYFFQFYIENCLSSC